MYLDHAGMTPDRDDRPTILSRAGVTMFQEEDAASGIGRTVYDAVSLDRLGHMGVARYFAKGALRRRFLYEKLMICAGVELIYAHHPADVQDCHRETTGPPA